MEHRFTSALKFTLRWEGGFVHDPADSGGATNYGVTQGVYDRFRTRAGEVLQSVKFIQQEEVRTIYYDLYWLAAGCDDLPGHVALAHFDWAVNHGVAGSIITLQLVVGAKPDGKFGPMTRAAVAVYTANHGETGLCSALIAAREAWYRQRIAQKPSQKKFLKGWLNRTSALRRWIGIE